MKRSELPVVGKTYWTAVPMSRDALNQPTLIMLGILPVVVLHVSPKQETSWGPTCVVAPIDTDGCSRISAYRVFSSALFNSVEDALNDLDTQMKRAVESCRMILERKKERHEDTTMEHETLMMTLAPDDFKVLTEEKTNEKSE